MFPNQLPALAIPASIDLSFGGAHLYESKRKKFI
jgi:hypothetical protein